MLQSDESVAQTRRDDELRMQFDNKIIQKCLILIIIFQVVFIFLISQKRYFNFDEFQVLYASASLVKGKALYNDKIGCHFPLVNIIFALMLKAVGFKTVALLAARIVIILTIFLTLYLTYKIAIMIRDAEAGLLAAILTMSSLAFLDKGIEIRHDVFNMFFNIAGVYWAARYFKTNNKLFVILSGVCLGLALAATQKAFIWNFGILTGVSVFIIKEYGFPKLAKVLFVYALSIWLTLSIIMLVLITVYNETFFSIIKITILDTYSYLIPNSLLKVKPASPFPFSKLTVLQPLLLDNGLLYIMSIIGITIGLKNIFKKSELKIIVIFPAFIGLLFFLYMKRPFYQSLLPTIPFIGILAAIFLTDLNKKLSLGLIDEKKRLGVSIITILLLLGWPTYSVAKAAFTNNHWMVKQMQNISFCLENLKFQDKVLCFTEQQIFFDSIFHGLRSNECGLNITTMDAKCFKQKMINNECKIVIYDYRTSILNNKIQEEIKNNYIYTGTGHILIPGFELSPDAEINRLIWTPGVYYSPTLELIVNGHKIENNLINLNQQVNSFKNLTSKSIRLVYIFHPELSEFKDKNTNRSNSTVNNVQE